MVLVIAISIQIKTIKASTANVGTNLRDNGGLRDELLSMQGKYQSLYQELENKDKVLEATRQNAATNNESDSKNEEEIKNNQKLLGLTDVSGQGLIITLDENREVDSNEVLNINGYLVHEEDLLYIVNELFNSGADAVSINDERIVN